MECWQISRVRKRTQEAEIEVQGGCQILPALRFLFLCGWAATKSLLVVGLCFFGLCKGIYDASLTASYYDVIPPARRSTATGVMNLIGWIGAGIGAVAVGFAVDHGFTMSAAISSTAAVYLLVGLTLWLTSALTAARDIGKVNSLV